MSLDPVLLELLGHKLRAATEEMGITLSRTALSAYVKETQDFGTALVTPEGRFFACPADTGVALAINFDCAATLRAVDGLAPGDIVMTNHPYLAPGLGSHLPDINLLQPYFHAGELLCYGWSFSHCADLGGAVPSSISPGLEDIFQEGLQVPPILAGRDGRLDPAITAMIRANSRAPEIVLGDLNAQLAALAVGARRVAEIVAQHGAADFRAARQALLEYAASRARAVQRRIPDGCYEFWDYLDDDFRSRIPVRLRARMQVRDGAIALDLHGSAPQLASPYNVPTGGTNHPHLTAKILHLLATYDRDLPLNAGLFDNVTVRVPAGCVMNPQAPAAVGIRHATAIRFADVVLGCLAQAAPELAPAASGGTVIPVVVAQPEPDGSRRVAVIQSLAGGGGATARGDGADGRDRSLANIRNTPTENSEAEAAVRVEHYGMRTDSGGAGKFRGGAGIIYAIRVLRDGTQLLGRGLERFVFRPWGAQGGAPGQAARVVLNAGTPGERELGKIDMVTARAGDVLTIMTPGGGGHGDPFSRDPARVQDDVRRGYVSLEAACRDYGVVLDAATLEIDPAATAQRRAGREPAPPGFGFDPLRQAWDSVFDDATMSALAEALRLLPAATREQARRAIFEAVVPGVARDGAAALLTADHAAARLRLRAELETLRHRLPAAT